ncbi:MAG: hypothetical protein WCS88_04795 [Patescibacteria group bacterium]|jgi:hypothetical protein
MIKQFLKPNKKKILLTIVLFIVVIIIFCFILLKNNELPYDKIVKYDKDLFCQSNADCALVSVHEEDNKCCMTCETTVLNLETAKRQSAWWEENCRDTWMSECPIYDCLDRKSVIRCVNNTCQIKFSE